MEDGKCSCGTDGKYTVIKLTQDSSSCEARNEGLLLVVIEQKAQKE